MIKEHEFGYELYQRIFKVIADWIKEESIRDPKGLGPEAVDAIFSAYGTAIGKIAVKLAVDVPELKSAIIATLDKQHSIVKKLVQREGRI
jgi:hypothetical protein